MGQMPTQILHILFGFLELFKIGCISSRMSEDKAGKEGEADMVSYIDAA
jgi:hypothetical protein